MSDEEHHHMDMIVPNLWIGNIRSATDVATLKANNIHSVFSAMRGRLSINPTFVHRQVNLDDEDDADILPHLVPAIAFIEAELEKDRGVLVHCQAGMSRSATIVAAYIMYSRGLDVAGALELMRKARPIVEPNDGFLYQLEVFAAASFKVTRHNKTTRMYYLERAVNDMLNGGETQTDMWARFPRSPGDSAPSSPTPYRRRIRCKMCRQELATREHMFDHGSFGPPTPASLAARTPAGSRRGSAVTSPIEPLTPAGPGPGPIGGVERKPSRAGSIHDARPRRKSQLGPEKSGGLFGRNLADMQALSMSALDTSDSTSEEEAPPPPPLQRRRSSAAGRAAIAAAAQLEHPPPGGAQMGRRLSESLSLLERAKAAGELAGSALDDGDSDGDAIMATAAPPNGRERRRSSESAAKRPFGMLSDSLSMSSMPPSKPAAPAPPPLCESPSPIPTSGATPQPLRGLGDALKMTAMPSQPSSAGKPFPTVESPKSPLSPPATEGADSSALPTASSPPLVSPAIPKRLSGGGFVAPSTLSDELFSNPKLAALRSPAGGGLGMTPIQGNSSSSSSSGAKPIPPSVPPILADPNCSGYFLEPMKWMEPFLEGGQLSGKIVCPNKKCGAKLGNYDWAGVKCGCKEWVTPGFCIHRSKVDEVL